MDTTTTTKCHRCGRALRSETSVSRGYGPTCHAKIVKAAKVADAKPAQVEKALELIELGGIVPIRGRRVFKAVSSDGTKVYRTAPQGCTCAAGLRGRHLCLHRIAASLMIAAPHRDRVLIAA